MMFRTIAILSALKAASASKAVELPNADIPATSKLGSRILSASRQLDGNDDFSWVAGYSIKFEKCATSDDYYGGYFGGEENQGGNNNNDGRQYYSGMYKQRLVHYKLCPTGSCASGCDGGADYVIDMNVFVEAFIESKLDAQEYNCEMVRENCYYDDEYQCYVNAGLDYCGDNDNDNNNNNNNNGQNQAQFQLEDAVECSELDVDDEALQYYYYQQQGNNNNQQQYYNGNNNQNQEMKLFVGPYCSANGKNIYLGTFMDETCSFEAPSGTYEQFNYGQALPYSSENLIDDDCVSCKEPADADENNDGDNDDADEVLEVCELLYEDAGKCESGLASGTVYYPNTYSCDFIDGLKAPGKMKKASSNIAASTVFAGLFAATSVVFGGVSYYLYQKVKRSNVDLASGGGALA